MSSSGDEYDKGYISTNDIKDIWGGSQIYLDNNSRDSRLKIHYCINQAQSEYKG